MRAEALVERALIHLAHDRLVPAAADTCAMPAPINPQPEHANSLDCHHVHWH